jgi:hypothetical protein
MDIGVDRANQIITSRIEEEITWTRGAKICTFLLIITTFLSLVVFIAAGTVFGQIEAALFLIAATLLFGLVIALGRKRTLIVYQGGPANLG